MHQLHQFNPKLHVFICTNDRTGIPNSSKPSCGPIITEQNVKEIKQWIRDNGLTGIVYCTNTKCLGGCNSQGGVVCVYPSGKFFAGIRSIEEMKSLIEKELNQI